MSEPVLYGAAYSVYVRAARLALAEKGVSYWLVEVDIFGAPDAEHLRRHPFGRIPAFEHDGFTLYETSAIERYVDEAFPGPVLQPPDAKRRARMNQIVALLDNYAYRTLVWDIYVERVDAPANGRVTDETRIAKALPKAELCLSELERLMGDGPWLTGDTLTLADLHAAPIIAPFRVAPEGKSLMSRHAGLEQWWKAIAARDSFATTQP